MTALAAVAAVIGWAALVILAVVATVALAAYMWSDDVAFDPASAEPPPPRPRH